MSFSWSLVGQRLTIPYEAPQGRRVNAIGIYFSHGPLTGRFEFVTYARLPERTGNGGRAAENAVRPLLGMRQSSCPSNL